MKHNIIFTAMLAMAIAFTSCGDDDEESCTEDEICTAEVTVCCTENSCKYVVDGQEYDSREEAEANTPECTAERAPDSPQASVADRLKSLEARAKANL